MEEALRARDDRIRRETLEAVINGIYKGVAETNLDPAADRALIALAKGFEALLADK